MFELAIRLVNVFKVKIKEFILIRLTKFMTVKLALSLGMAMKYSHRHD